MVILKILALVLSLGMDTLMVSITLGFLQTKGKLRIALTFACAEAIMPLIGLIVGGSMGQLFGHWAALIGGMALLSVAAWLLFFEDEGDENNKLGRQLAGWTLVLTAVSISLDELAVGFSIGLIGVPVALTVLAIAAQAIVFTMVGLTFGSRLRRYLGEWAERVAGVVMGALGLWIVALATVRVLHG